MHMDNLVLHKNLISHMFTSHFVDFFDFFFLSDYLFGNSLLFNSDNDRFLSLLDLDDEILED